MTSEVEKRPRLVMGCYGRRRHQWVNKLFIILLSALIWTPLIGLWAIQENNAQYGQSKCALSAFLTEANDNKLNHRENSSDLKVTR